MIADVAPKNRNKNRWVTVGLPILLFLTVVLFTRDPEILLLDLLCVFGIFISTAILSYLMHHADPVARVFCRDKGMFSCDEVLTSPAAKVSKNISWADIGLVYFSALSTFILFAAVAGYLREAALIVMIPATGAFLASFFSLWYQGWVLGKWCRLCLTVILLVWLQESTLLAFFIPAAGHMNIFFSLFHHADLARWTALLVLCFLLASGWFFIKPYITIGQEAQQLRFQIRRWKRSASLFVHLLKKQSRISQISLASDIIMGADTAPITMVIVLSLYCPSCKREYAELKRLLTKYPNDLQVIIRVRHPDHSKRPDALPYLLAWHSGAIDQRAKLEVFTVWFDTMDIAKSMEKLGFVSPPDHADIRGELDAWFAGNNIKQTPSLFLDHYPLPEPFILTDLNLLIPSLKKRADRPPVPRSAGPL
jgi:uncharacterized membrane protein